MTVGKRGVQLIEVLTCVPEKGEQVLREDAMGIVVVRLFARSEAGGIYMALSALE